MTVLFHPLITGSGSVWLGVSLPRWAVSKLVERSPRHPSALLTVGCHLSRGKVQPRHHQTSTWRRDWQSDIQTEGETQEAFRNEGETELVLVMWLMIED